jgi:hypothetical protein
MILNCGHGPPLWDSHAEATHILLAMPPAMAATAAIAEHFEDIRKWH